MRVPRAVRRLWVSWGDRPVQQADRPAWELCVAFPRSLTLPPEPHYNCSIDFVKNRTISPSLTASSFPSIPDGFRAPMSRFLFRDGATHCRPWSSGDGSSHVVMFVAYGFSRRRSSWLRTATAVRSTALHAGELGMDCRYCHNTVEKAAHAGVPRPDLHELPQVGSARQPVAGEGAAQLPDG